MIQKACITLEDGRLLEYEIRPSASTTSLRLKMTARNGLTVIVPQGLAEGKIQHLVANKQEWILSKLSHFDEVRTILGTTPTAPPQAFALPALAESWLVEYQKSRAATVRARSVKQGRVIVSGAIDDPERCNSALRRWLARRAKCSLGGRLCRLSQEIGLSFKAFAIKSQKTRWGSCSPSGVISLNCKLLFLEPHLVRYVLVHELCHLVEPNHSAGFWTLLKQFEPCSETLHEGMASGWKKIPPWAHHPNTLTA